MKSLICRNEVSHLFHDSFLCAMTMWMGRLFMGRLFMEKVRGPFICVMTHLYVPRLKSLLYWKHTSAVYFTQKSMNGENASAVYFTQKSTLLKTHLSSLLYWKHTSTVYFTEKSTVPRKKLGSLLYSEVYCTANAPQQSTLLKTYLSNLLYPEVYFPKEIAQEWGYRDSLLETAQEAVRVARICAHS